MFKLFFSFTFVPILFYQIMAARKKCDIDLSSEEKIKEAARVVFQKKGYAATRTRDIAEEAGINLALLNYYFRSKENLFELIMMETMRGFVHDIGSVLNNENTTLMQKIELVATNYIDFVIQNPDLPLFMLSEMRNNVDALLKKPPIEKLFIDSVCFKQIQQAANEGHIKNTNPFHFLINLLGLVIFPFLASPMLKCVGNFNDDEFNKLVQERKRLIPIWIEAVMSAG